MFSHNVYLENPYPAADPVNKKLFFIIIVVWCVTFMAQQVILTKCVRAC